jgi:predicted phage replisome organizer
MAEKRFYWIKLKTDFFNQEAIDFLMAQENGCEYIVLYQMLCLQTSNNRGLLSTQIGEMIVPYDVKKIVRDTKYFDFDTVTIALELFKRLGLVYEENDKILRIANFDEMVGSEAANANAQRQKRFRERQKVIEGVTNSNAYSNALPVTENNEEIENRDKRKEIRDKEKDIEGRDRINYQLIADLYNDTCVSFPRVTSLSETRKKAIKARLNIYSLDDFKRLFEKAEASNFLKGQNDRNWTANFDWLIKDGNMAKVLDGNYDNKPRFNQDFNQPTNKAAEQLESFYNMAAGWAESE